MLKGVGGGLKGEEERVTVGHRVVYPVRDHEEWPQLVRVAEGGIFVAQGFVVRDRTRGGYVTDSFETEGALAGRSWAQRLATARRRRRAGVGQRGLGGGRRP